MSRISCRVLSRPLTVNEAGAHIEPDDSVGISGFTGVDHPRAALSRHVRYSETSRM